MKEFLLKPQQIHGLIRIIINSFIGRRYTVLFRSESANGRNTINIDEASVQ